MLNNPQITETEKHMQQLDFLLFIFYIQDRKRKDAKCYNTLFFCDVHIHPYINYIIRRF